MKRTPLVAAAAALSVPALASAQPERPGAQLSAGPFLYLMSDHCCSSPAALTGLDLTYDHDLTPRYGVRVRAGAVLFGVDEIEGRAPHLDAGAYARARLGPRLAVDAALLAGVEHGGLDHKEMVEPELGPTAAAEAVLVLALSHGLIAQAGAGYRLSLAQNAPGELARGPVIRVGLGWRF